MGAFDHVLAMLGNSDARDRLLSRRQNWDGTAFYLPALPGMKGAGYYRFLGNSPGTANFAYIGTERPRGEIVYLWEPNTVDYKAIPATVFKPWWVVLSLVLTVLWTLFVTYVQVDGFEPVYWSLGMIAIVFDFCFRWFYAVEPVRGSKVSAAIVAAGAARQATRKHDSRQVVREQERMWRQAQENPGGATAQPSSTGDSVECEGCRGSGWCSGCMGKGQTPHGMKCQRCWGSGKCGRCSGSGQRR